MNIMNDWVVEGKSFIEELLDGKYFMLNQNGVNDVVKIIKDYKSRIDKAIEYIENNFISYEDSRTFGQLGEEIEIQVKEIRDLLKILKGSDKE